MSFSGQALAAQYLIDNKDTLENQVYVVPTEVDQRIAGYKLNAMGVEIDTLTEQQSAGEY